ncbi:protein TMA23 [Kluyveromyces marxianus]|uniref:Protein TMA23 n=1 Tax=Kluyveromyces marxianus TaxID=4911 RepID=A0ABX6ENY3_KLUMA|nr:protein TMA23 [Kluyveromyces marxianus]
MDSKGYLKSYGWEEGEALRHGGLKKPILVKHKKDKKGLGCAPGNDDSEAWWERLFDGQLRGLDVQTGSNGISFKQSEVIASSVSKSESPLYKWFVRGEVLKGTIEIKLPNEDKSSVVKVTELAEKDTNKKEKKKTKKEKKEKKKEKSDKSKKSSKHKSKDKKHKSKYKVEKDRSHHKSDKKHKKKSKKKEE